MMKRFLVNKILAFFLLMGIILSEVGSVSVYADAVDEIDSSAVDNNVRIEMMADTESVLESESEFLEETETESDSEDDVSEETEADEETVYIQETEEAVTFRIITGFVGLNNEDRKITVNSSEKPEFEDLIAMMPSVLEVYLDGAATPTEIPVSWFCVTEDYENSNAYYFQFSPSFDESSYRLSDTIDLLLDAPYISVSMALEVSSEVKTLNAADIEANKKQVFNALTQDMKMNSAAACGVMANIECESDFDPQATGDSGSSYGLCQWHESRKEDLIKYCSDNGYDYTTVDGQMKFLKYELVNSYASIYDYMLNQIDNTGDGAYEAASYWCKEFERPANADTMAVTRGNLARDTYWPEYGSTAALSVPVISDIANVSTGVKVTWGSVSGASGYHVYRRSSSDSGWVLAGTVVGGSAVSYTDTDVVSGKTYDYAVAAFSGDDDEFDQYVTTEAVNYRTGPGTSYDKAGTLSKGTTVRVVPGYSVEADGYTWYKIYYTGDYYYVVAQYLEKCSDNTDETNVRETEKSSLKSILYLSAPVLETAANVSNGIKVTWDKVPGAAVYYVYRKVSGGKYSLTGKVSDANTLSYTDDTVQSGTTYVYTVRAGKGSTLSAYNSTISMICLSSPVLNTAANAGGGIKLTWDKVSGATAYYVYRKEEGGKYTLHGKATGGNTLSYTDNTAENGTTYIYTVRAGNGKNLSYFNSTKTVLCLDTPVLSGTEAVQNGIRINWKKVSGASGYYLYRKTGDGKWSRVASVGSGTTVSYTDTSTVGGTTYTYTVRAYKGNTLSWFDEKGVSGKYSHTLVKYKTTENVNYRTGPGTSYSVAGTLSKGTTVQVVSGYSTNADGYTWYKIYLNGQYYYACAKYLKKV